MKRTRDLQVATKELSSGVAHDDDDDDEEEQGEISVKIVPFDCTHKYIHFTYSWIEGVDSGEPLCQSALIDVTDLAPADREALRSLLDDESVAHDCLILVVDDQEGSDHHWLSKKDRARLEDSKWCKIPDEKDTDDTKIAQIVSFVHVQGVY
jgi:hypothetical protein